MKIMDTIFQILCPFYNSLFAKRNSGQYGNVKYKINRLNLYYRERRLRLNIPELEEVPAMPVALDTLTFSTAAEGQAARGTSPRRTSTISASTVTTSTVTSSTSSSGNSRSGNGAGVKAAGLSLPQQQHQVDQREKVAVSSASGLS